MKVLDDIRNRWLKRAALALLLASLPVFGYLVGLRQCEQRKRTIDVYGCGVHRRIRATPERQLIVQDLLLTLGPLPTNVNGLFIQTPQGNYYCRLAEAVGTNGIGRLPLFGGEYVTLVHRTD